LSAVLFRFVTITIYEMNKSIFFAIFWTEFLCEISTIANSNFVLPLTSVAKISRSMKRSNGESISLSVNDTNLEFLVAIGIGNPVQNFTLTLSAGSSDLELYALNCVNCPKSALYVYNGSDYVGCNNSFCQNCSVEKSVNACVYTYTFQNGEETYGLVASEIFQLGFIRDIRSSFCYVQGIEGFIYVGILYLTLFTAMRNYLISLQAIKPFRIQRPPSGILGLLNSNEFSAWNGPPFISNLFSQMPGLTKSFSLCGLDKNGSMTIGVDYSSNPAFSWIPISTTNSFYSVSITDIRVNGTSLGLSSNVYDTSFCYIDPGTDYIELQPVVYRNLTNTFLEFCNYTQLFGFCGSDIGFRNGECVELEASQINAYPNVTLYFNGISTPFVLTPQNYLVPFEDTYCFSFLEGSTSLILGASFIRAFHVVFDLENSNIGIGPISTCPSVPELFTTSEKSSTSSSTTSSTSSSTSSTISSSTTTSVSTTTTSLSTTAVLSTTSTTSTSSTSPPLNTVFSTSTTRPIIFPSQASGFRDMFSRFWTLGSYMLSLLLFLL